MSDIPCAVCGRERWTGDRFCPSCGNEFPHPEGADPVDNELLAYGHNTVGDLDGAEQPSGTGRRDSLIGLGVLAGLITAVGLLFVIGRGSTDPQAAATDPQTLATPTSAPISTPADLSPAPTPATTPAARPTATAVVTPIAAPTQTGIKRHAIQSAAEMRPAFEPLDFGGGWLVAADRGRVVAVDLDNERTVSAAGARIQSLLGGYVTTDGVLTKQLTGGFTSWELFPWDGSEPTSIRTGFDTLAVFDDPSAGPIIVSGEQQRTGHFEFAATSARTRVVRKIEAAEPASLLWPRSLMTEPTLRTPDIGFFTDDGESIYSWTWTDGWVEFAPGQLAFADRHGVVGTTCEGPTRCQARVFGPDGVAGPEFDAAAVGSRLVVSLMRLVSPDRSKIAILNSDIRPAMERPRVLILDTETGESRRVGLTDFNWWMIHAWSPNGRYLIASGEAGLGAIDVETGETAIIAPSSDAGITEALFMSSIAID